MDSTEPNSKTQGNSLSATESAANDPAPLLKRQQLARVLNASPRSVDNWQKQKIIPVIKISPRCVRFHLPSGTRGVEKIRSKGGEPVNGLPGKRTGVLQQTPITKLNKLPQNNSTSTIAQVRQLELFCILARTLVEIDKKLGLLFQHSDFLSARRINGHSKNSGVLEHGNVRLH